MHLASSNPKVGRDSQQLARTRVNLTSDHALTQLASTCHDQYTPCPENGVNIYLPLSLSNANRFSKFFH